MGFRMAAKRGRFPQGMCGREACCRAQAFQISATAKAKPGYCGTEHGSHAPTDYRESGSQGHKGAGE